MKVLVAGPWVGEFGWELLCWHSYIRTISKFFDKTICLSRSTSKYLYDDICDVFLEYHVEGIADGWKNTGFVREKEKNKISKKIECYLKKDDEVMWVPPIRCAQTHGSTYHHYSEKMFLPFSGPDHTHVTITPTYTVLGKNNKEKKYDYLIHARARQDIRPECNWDKDNWAKLVIKLKKNDEIIGSIGTRDSSYFIEGTDDLRGKPLSEVTEYLNNAKCSFGPSSGAMHLASLCNSPHVVWANNYNSKRYREFWNPHSTPVLFLDKFEFQPSPEYIIEKFSNWNMKTIEHD